MRKGIAAVVSIIILYVLFLATTLAYNFFADFVTPALIPSITFWLLLFFGAAYLALLPVMRGIAQAERPKRMALISSALMLGVVLAVRGGFWVSARAQVEPVEPTPALEGHAVALPAVDADAYPALRDAFADRRVVALGEATHGTSEFFIMKDHIIRYMVTELGYRHFAMEVRPASGEQMNAYIQGGDVEVANHMYWPWRTEEVIAMLGWMRAFNATAEEPIILHAIDEGGSDERDQFMAENVQQILDETGGPVVMWGHNGHVANNEDEGAMGYLLKQELGEEVYLLGFEFHHGHFADRWLNVQTFELGDAPRTYYAHALAPLDADILFLNFENPTLEQWASQPHAAHDIGAGFIQGRFFPSRASRTPWATLYDGVIFIEESTPSQVVEREPTEPER
jgi:erythromycin esterase-like protein